MNENMLIDVGARIQKLREAKGLTQSQLADELGVRRAVVSKWELGIQDLKTEYTVKLAEFFGVSCDELLRGIKSENSTVNYELGLSEQAIQTLKIFVEQQNEEHLKVINGILSGGELLTDWLYAIEEYIEYFESEKDMSGEGFGCIVENDPELYAALMKCRSVGMEIVDSYDKKMLAKSNIEDNLDMLVEFVACKIFNKDSLFSRFATTLCELIGEYSETDSKEMRDLFDDYMMKEQGESNNGEH